MSAADAARPGRRGDRVTRREFITLLGGVAAAWPLAARGQQPVRTAKVGVLHPGQAANVSMRITAIREGLSGPDTKESAVEIIVRLADGELARLPALATDLVNQRVDTIVAAGPPAVQAARGSTATIPVVAVDLESDPVASGLVASLAHPGGNVTGVFLDFPDFSAKCLQLLIEAVPATQVGVLWDPTTGPLQLSAVESAAKSLGIGLHVFETRRLADIAEAFYGLDRSRTQGALILSSPLFGGNPQMVADLATRGGVPTISLFPDVAREGGLLAYGPDIQGLYRQAAGMARKVLQGAKPADMPAERPTRFQLVANLKAAKRIGIELPTSILVRADEVIE
jgi:putative ABC transport system substrate-binding protein